MSGDTMYKAPKRHKAKTMRTHDYLYDSAFIVSGARDYARTAFKAAMASAQLGIQPVYATMFADNASRVHVVCHPNCRLPEHMDRSYGAYLRKRRDSLSRPLPQIMGRDRFKFTAAPKEVLAVTSVTLDFHPPSPRLSPALMQPRSRGTQSVYRESSAQTVPWQTEGVAAGEHTPEVLYLDKLEWGPGCPYRTGDLPADFHTTEIINKMRHARTWYELVEKGHLQRWMKRPDSIIGDLETKDWIFREAEIDELQEIRLELLHRLQQKQRCSQNSRARRQLASTWARKKEEMERKIGHIRMARDRELRKLSAAHEAGGKVGKVSRMREARGMGDALAAARDPASEMYAPLARHGYQARRRHAVICYDPNLLSLEDHRAAAEPPAWLDSCGQDLKRSCSGHHLPRDTAQLCERESKWSEQFLKNLHSELKMARLGAALATTAGPLRVLKPRRLAVTPRPATPAVDDVPDDVEEKHQAALLLQRVIRGRAVQNLMYEGRTRAAELTSELKTTHGLQRDDKARVARDEARARDYVTVKAEAEQKENAISAIVDELTGGAVSAALDFLEKELRRLREERRQHAFILIALREKVMREAAEAGRRQKEEHRRREHDEMFKQVLGVTQETVDVYLKEIVCAGVELAAEEDAVRQARAQADRVDESILEHRSMSTAEQNETIAELVNQFLLPATQRAAARHMMEATQQARLGAAAREIFNLVDDAEVKELHCIRCGCPLGELCRCRECPLDVRPVETEARDDPRWKFTRVRDKRPAKTMAERFPVDVEVRRVLNALVDEAVQAAKEKRYAHEWVARDCAAAIRERLDVAIDAAEMTQFMVDRATGATYPPVKEPNSHYYMARQIEDALGRTRPPKPCPLELPSELRRRAEAEVTGTACLCDGEEVNEEDAEEKPDVTFLPSELRQLEEMRRCKCDTATATPTSDFTYGDLGASEQTEESEYTPISTPQYEGRDYPGGDDETQWEP